MLLSRILWLLPLVGVQYDKVWQNTTSRDALLTKGLFSVPLCCCPLVGIMKMLVRSSCANMCVCMCVHASLHVYIDKCVSVCVCVCVCVFLCHRHLPCLGLACVSSSFTCLGLWSFCLHSDSRWCSLSSAHNPYQTPSLLTKEPENAEPSRPARNSG